MKKKAVGLLVSLLLLLGAAVGNMALTSRRADYVAAAGAQSVYRLDVCQGRGAIYDRDLTPLVGGATQTVAAVAPTIQAVGALEQATGGQYRQRLAQGLSSGQPFLLTLESPVQAQGVEVFQVPQRYQEDQLAPHLIGYLDSLGGGAAGVELCMDDVLRQCAGEISVTYRVDAVGRAIAGEEPQVVNTLSRTEAGVALTLDADLQRLVEEAGAALGKGAVVVTQVPDCQVLALASFPDFSPLDLGAAQGEDAPLVNRAFSAYAPGSVWKLAAAAALLEEGLGDLAFTCVGSLNAGGLQFHCAGHVAHGPLDLQGALACSCNCYFINAVRVLGGQKLLSMAYNLGFGEAQEFGRGLWSAAGELPTLDSLGNPRALANFSFGQGELTVTPLQVCAMLNTIASGGVYTSPHLILGLVGQGRQLEQAASSAEKTLRAMAPSTAAALEGMLLFAGEEGTGSGAAPSNGRAGIKTGTAQTGVYQGEEELLHFWYAGIVWDGEEPRWCVTVLKEGAAKDQGATAQVFRQVAQALCVQGGQSGGTAA